MKNKIDKELNDWYAAGFKKFEDKMNGHSKSFLHKNRKDAIVMLDELGFPTQKNEEWKYTNISNILKHKFTPAFISDDAEVGEQIIAENVLSGIDCNLLVFVNGLYKAEYSKLDCLPDGVIIDSLENVLKTNPELAEEKLGKLAKLDNSFNALNEAFSLDGLFVYVPDGKVIEQPIQVLYLNGDNKNNVLSSPRNLIIAGKNTQVSVIANFRGVEGSVYLSNIITEVFVEENGLVDLYKIQDENHSSYHIEKVEAYQKPASVFHHYSFSFGGAIARNDISSNMDGENIESNFWGLYLANDDQLVDHHTFADHAKPNCLSNEVYKGILDGKSHGVFNGKILVRQDAQKTNAYQTNQTVLLSDDARIDTKPQLEIFADDVKCSHGATVGHLDDEAYFYIRSRGVPSNIAKSMLIRAFANDVVEKVKIEELRDQINHMIFEHLHQIEI